MATFNGSSSDDVYTGGSDNDTIIGAGGADTLSGAGGGDTISGGAGSDSLSGGDGDDRIYTADVSPDFNIPYYSNPWTAPVLDTGAEVDTVTGGDGSDRIFAGYGDNVDGGAGGIYGDYLYISFMGATSGVTADFTQATQVVGGGTITGIENISWVQGSNYDDTINVGSASYGYSDFTAVFGMGGADQLIAGYYTGTMFGGDGNDIVDGRNSQYLQAVYGDAGNDILYTNANTFASAYGGDGDDLIYSHGLTYGGAGNDTIQLQQTYYSGATYGEDGDDTIVAATGVAARISGGAGADTITGGDGADVLSAGDITNGGYVAVYDMALDHDVIAGMGGDDVISIGYGDSADGGSGSDTLWLSFGGLASGLTFSTSGIVSAQPYSLAGGVITNIEALAYLLGTAYADNFTLATQATLLTLDAGAGDDIITAVGSSVSVTGGQGADRFISGSAGDYFDGDGGTDTLDYSTYGSGVTVTMLTGTGTGGDSFISVENVDGSGFNDTLTGDSNVNVIRGLGGDDFINGGAGADSLYGGAGNDTFVVDNIGEVVVEVAGEGIDTVQSAISYTLVAEVEKLLLTGSANINGTGNSLANEITGNSGANVLDGAGGDDTLIGGNGDTLIGGTGADTLDGSAGVVTASYATTYSGVVVNLLTGVASYSDAQGDVLISIENLIGSQSDDQLTGDSGSNVIDGGAGSDFIDGGAGVDIASYASATAGVVVALTLSGAQDTVGSGMDMLTNIEGLIGSAFDDALSGNGGDNVLDGGSGVDRLSYWNATNGVTVSLFLTTPQNTGGAGTDTVSHFENLTGSSFADVLSGDSGSNTLDGGGGIDTLSYSSSAGGVTVSLALTTAQNTGGAGTDTIANFENLTGSSFDDVLTGNTGNNIINGGGGFDTVSYNAATAGITIDLSVGTAQSGTGGLGSDTLSSIEGVVGSHFDDTITGNSSANTLIGGDGFDILDGGGGIDTLSGGYDSDLYYVDSQGDLIFEGPNSGIDSVISTVGYYLWPHVENLTLAAGAGSIFGVGNDLANVLEGNEGDNLLIAGGGDDDLWGGAGNDALFGQDGLDLISGEAGVDYIVGGAGADGLWGDEDADALYGQDGDDYLSGGDDFATDILVGGNGADILDGQSYLGDYDLMDGGLGDDIYFVDTPNDLTFEALNAGDDTVYANINGAGYYLYANVENLVLEDDTPFGVGNALDNVLIGSDSVNWLLGGAGDDIIDGMGGNDVLFGEAGGDVFVFERGTKIDTVGDFEVGVDWIALTADTGITSFASVLAHAVQVGNSTAIDLGQGDVIILSGIPKSALITEDFLFI